MESNDSKKSEPVSADRRAFMKTVVTGAVAAGVVAASNEAQAASLPSGCGEVSLPPNPVQLKVVFNKLQPPTLEELHQWIDITIGQSGCPNCGLGGVINPGVGTIYDIKFEMAHLSRDQASLVLLQDVVGIGG